MICYHYVGGGQIRPLTPWLGINFCFTVRIDPHLQLQLHVHKKNSFTTQNTPTLTHRHLRPSALGKLKLGMRSYVKLILTDSIYEIRIVLWAYKQ